MKPLKNPPTPLQAPGENSVSRSVGSEKIPPGEGEFHFHFEKNHRPFVKGHGLFFLFPFILLFFLLLGGFEYSQEHYRVLKSPLFEKIHLFRGTLSSLLLFFIALYLGRSLEKEKLYRLEQLGVELEKRVQEKTLELKEKNRKLNSHKEMLEKELQLAYLVQNRLNRIPEGKNLRYEILWNYLQILKVGGDGYKILELPENKLLILLYDTVGHGIQAALISILIEPTFLKFGENLTSPSAFFNDLNISLNQIISPGQFICAFCAVLDLKTGHLVFSNAGMPPPILFGNEFSGGVVEETLNPYQLPLGVSEDFLFTDRALIMEPGQVLFLFTDGVLTLFDRGTTQTVEEKLKGLNTNEPLQMERLLKERIAICQKKGPLEDDILYTFIRFFGEAKVSSPLPEKR